MLAVPSIMVKFDTFGPFLKRKVVLWALHTVPLLALFFIGYIAWRNWQELPNYQWSIQQLAWLGLAFFLYPISLLFMIINWRQIGKHLNTSTDISTDIYIYCLNTFSQRLPLGAVWSIGGRIASYNRAGVASKIPLLISFIELALHTLSAFLIWSILEIAGYGFVYQIAINLSYQQYGVLTIGLLFVMGLGLYAIQYQRRKILFSPHQSLPLTQLMAWLSLYGLTWINASLMLWLTIQGLGGVGPSFGNITAAWAFVGFIGHLLSNIPFLSIGIKEITLVLILTQFMPLSIATLTTILFRLLLTIADAVWPTIFILLTRRF
jgi:hypothetical protein